MLVAQIEAEISQAIPLLPKSPIRIFARVLAGVFILLYKYAAFQFLQLFVAYATINETEVAGKKIRPLVEIGRMIGVGDPQAATRAELVLDVTVQTEVGGLDAFSQLVRTETGIVYTTIEPVDLDAPTIQVTVRASSDPDGGNGAGTIGNLEAGDIVSFAKPIPNVARDAVVVSVSVAGADAEDPEVYRRRIQRHLQARPQGGAYADYRLWAEEVEGIVAVYPYTGTLPGEVDVYCEASPSSSGSEDGVPTSEQLTAVYDIIQLNEAGKATRRPIGAAVNTLPIFRSAFAVEITGLTPDTPDTRSAIVDAMDEFLRTRRPFILGLSVLPREDRITQALLGGIVSEIAAADGASVTGVEVTPGPSSTLAHGELAKLGTVTWT